MGQTIVYFERAATNAERDAVPREDQCGLWFGPFGATYGGFFGVVFAARESRISRRSGAHHFDRTDDRRISFCY